MWQMKCEWEGGSSHSSRVIVVIARLFSSGDGFSLSILRTTRYTTVYTYTQRGRGGRDGVIVGVALTQEVGFLKGNSNNCN